MWAAAICGIALLLAGFSLTSVRVQRTEDSSLYGLAAKNGCHFQEHRVQHDAAKREVYQSCCFGDDVAKWLIGELRKLGMKAGEKPHQEDFGWYVAHTFCPPPETRPDLSPETAVLELPLWTGYQSALAVP